MKVAKLLVKQLAYRLGVLWLFHRLRNRNSLTVVMFHRVLAPSDPRYHEADPEWTMKTDSFDQCLQFFQRHYNIVSADQVFAAIRSEKSLPPRSLLVSFDDGWADTAQYALPILNRRKVPALIFVAGSAVGQPLPFWQERIFHFLAGNRDGVSQLKTIFLKHGISLEEEKEIQSGEAKIRAIIKQLDKFDPALLDSVTRTLPICTSPAAMLNHQELLELAQNHCIGGHGMTHQPLAKAGDVDHELRLSQETLSQLLGRTVESMSFPHGSYSDSIIEKSLKNRYKYLFSSESCLHRIRGNASLSIPIGRIHISEREIINKSGKVQKLLLASWLFFRPFKENAHVANELLNKAMRT